MLTIAFGGSLMWLVAGGFGVVAYIVRQRRLQAERDAIAAWAASRGYQPAERPAGDTPTLDADNGTAGPCYAVPVGDDDGALFAFSYSVGSGRDRVDVDTTVVQAQLSAGFPQFRVLPRHPRHLPPGPGGEQELDLESVEFHRDHQLLVARDGDREAVERLFDPETIVWWIGLGAGAPIVEYQLGCLVVRSGSALTGAAELDALVGQAQQIARRVLAEGLLHRPDAATPA